MAQSDLNELLGTLALTPELIARSIADLSEMQIRERKVPNEFSVVENVCHLRDLEVEAYTVRIDRILSEENPTLLDFDGSQVAAERDYNRQDPAAALAAFSEARKQNIARVSALEAHSLARTGMFEGVGIITLQDLLQMMREHDEGHLRDLENLVNK